MLKKLRSLNSKRINFISFIFEVKQSLQTSQKLKSQLRVKILSQIWSNENLLFHKGNSKPFFSERGFRVLVKLGDQKRDYFKSVFIYKVYLLQKFENCLEFVDLDGVIERFNKKIVKIFIFEKLKTFLKNLQLIIKYQYSSQRHFIWDLYPLNKFKHLLIAQHLILHRHLNQIYRLQYLLRLE